MRAKVALAQYRFAPRDDLDVDVAARWFSNNEHQMYHEPMGLIDRDREGLAGELWRDICAAYGIDAPLPRWQIVKEKRATFAATPPRDAAMASSRQKHIAPNR